MHQRTPRRRTPLRVVGWMLIASMYAALLVIAADISAVDDTGAGAVAEAAADTAVGVAAGAASVAGGAVEPVTAVNARGESPLVTLAIAGAVLGLFGMTRALRLVRRPRPVSARPIARRIQTLT
jgi:hypothetical protein